MLNGKSLIILSFVLLLGMSIVSVNSGLEPDMTSFGQLPDGWTVEHGTDWDRYYNPETGEYTLVMHSTAMNYQNDTGQWNLINCTFEYLDPGHPAYAYGYRVGNEKGIFNAYFKPNAQDDWPVAFAYNKSGSPIVHVLRSKLVGVGYLDPSHDWDYVILQQVQDSQGSINGSIGAYPNCFTGTNVTWRYDTNGLKEEIIATNDTKQAIQNHPPSEFGLSNQHSYLVFATEFDYKGLTMCNESGDLTGNFTIEGGSIRFRDAARRLKFTMPIGEVYELNNPDSHYRLTYRIVQQGDNMYLLSGIKLSTLNQMECPLVFDPTTNLDNGYVIADVYTKQVSMPQPLDTEHGFQMRWNITTLPGSVTITDASLNLFLKSVGAGVNDDTRCWRTDDQTWDETINYAAYAAQSIVNQTDALTWSSILDETRSTLNVTEFVRYEYQQSNDSVSFRIHDLDYTPPAGVNTIINAATIVQGKIKAFGAAEQLEFASRSHATTSMRPWLNITYTAPPSNALPEITMNYPTNQSTGEEGTPICNVTVTDADGNPMSIDWETNVSGSWAVDDTDAGLGDGDHTHIYTSFSSETTMYYWRINVSDGIGYNVSDVYHFTTTSAPTITNMLPANNTWNNTSPVTLYATTNQADGFVMNITWFNNRNQTVLYADGNNGNGTYSYSNWYCGNEAQIWNMTVTAANFTTSSPLYYFVMNYSWLDDFLDKDLVGSNYGTNRGLYVFLNQDSYANYSINTYHNTFAEGGMGYDVTMDASVYALTLYFFQTSPQIVFTNSTHGYAFGLDFALSMMYYWTTTDGGMSWSAPNILDGGAPDMCVAVWYDGWTYGDTGTKIHVLAPEAAADELHYTWYDTATGTTNGSWVTVADLSSVSTSQGPPTICKTPNGRLWAGSAGATRGLWYSDDDGVSWTGNKPSTLFDYTNDDFQVLPLLDNDLMLIYQDESTTDLLYATYWYDNDTWSSFGTLSTTSSVVLAGFSASYYMKTGNIFLAHLTDDESASADVEAYTFWANNRTWSPKTVLEANAYGYSVSTVVSQGNGDVYVFYNDGRAGLMDIYCQNSTDGGNTWGSRTQISHQTDDHRFTPCNAMGYDVLYATWVDTDDFDWFAAPIANYTRGSLDYTPSNITSVLITKPTGYNWTRFNADVNNTANSTFYILDASDDSILLSGLEGNDNDITNLSGSYNSVKMKGAFNGDVAMNSWNISAELDTAYPAVVINFAGNLSDGGGPYWRPPGESDVLDEAGEGDFRNGYYTNDSRQHEDWMYINCTVTDDVGVSEVWLNWLNGTTWTNWTYEPINTDGSYYEYNTSGNIQVATGYDYSFDIVANDTLSNSTIYQWNKTCIGGSYARRHIQFDCTQTNISYTPYYLYNQTPETGIYSVPDQGKADRLHHDQGADGTTTDTGYLNPAVPTDTVHGRHCSFYMGYWFENNISVESFTLDNVYYHIWWHTGNDVTTLGWYKLRGVFDGTMTDSVVASSTTSRSNITYGYPPPTPSNDFYLNTGLLDVTNTGFTDNDIYEFIFEQSVGSLIYPSLISNRSFTSFILFNVPNNATLNASHPDTDGDTLSDWTELYVTYTNPFLTDTDNDGINDYWENHSGSDPNNYTDSVNTLVFDINRTSFDFGTVQNNTVVYSNGSGEPDTLRIYNNGSCSIDIDVNGTNATASGVADWVLSPNNGDNLYKMEIYNSSTGWWQINLTKDTWYSNMPLSTSITANVRITTPIIFYSGKQMSCKIYMSASVH